MTWGAAVYGRLRVVDIVGEEFEKILSPSASARTQAPYIFGPKLTLNAVHRADILASIFSSFVF
jgi:hypothetical protein